MEWGKEWFYTLCYANMCDGEGKNICIRNLKPGIKSTVWIANCFIKQGKNHLCTLKMYLLIWRVIKQILVIIEAYHFC